MWLDLNGSPSLNYIHFTCHLVFKNRNHCSLGEKKTEQGSVFDMPEKAQTHLHQKYITQILTGIGTKLQFDWGRVQWNQYSFQTGRSGDSVTGSRVFLHIAVFSGEKKASSNRQRHRLLFTNGPPRAKAHQTNQEWRSAKRNRTLNEVVKILNPLLHNLVHPPLPHSPLNYWNYLLNLPHLVTFKTHLWHFMRRKRNRLIRVFICLPGWNDWLELCLLRELHHRQ